MDKRAAIESSKRHAMRKAILVRTEVDTKAAGASPKNSTALCFYQTKGTEPAKATAAKSKTVATPSCLEGERVSYSAGMARLVNEQWSSKDNSSHTPS